jgi:hypothetical protein
MQSLAILWFQLQMAEQSLREKYFAPAQVPAKTEPTTIGTPRRANRKVYSHFVETAVCIALAAVGLQVKFSLLANVLPAAQATPKTSVSFVQPEKAGAVDTVADTTVSVVHPEKSGATTLRLPGQLSAYSDAPSMPRASGNGIVSKDLDDTLANEQSLRAENR